jgi:hypothetical protein
MKLNDLRAIEPGEIHRDTIHKKKAQTQHFCVICECSIDKGETYYEITEFDAWQRFHFIQVCEDCYIDGRYKKNKKYYTGED